MDTFDNTGGSKNIIKESDLTYDQKFKQLFAKKVFIAPVLKNIIPEYKDLGLETIETLINTRNDVNVNPQVYSNDDSGKGDETETHYDVLADCALPDGETVCVGFFFDLEMQRENQPGYPVPKRGVYYCCRLISRQVENLGEEAYNQIKPVYSVWILINNIPKYLQNSIYKAELTGHSNKKFIDVSRINSQVGLIHLYLVYLSEDFRVEENGDNLIKYLQSVFTKQVDNPKFNPYYEYSGKIKKEVDDVMTIRESFEARGEARGKAYGIIEGKIELLLENDYTDVKIIEFLTTMKNNPLTLEQAKKSLKEYHKEHSV